MKQTATGIMAVYLTLVGLSAKAESPFTKAEEDAVVQKYRIEYQNPQTLKKRLLNQFRSIEGYDGAGIERLKQRFDISDEMMRKVAMEIYEESLVAVREKRTEGIDGGLNSYRQQLAGALFCLGLSADQTTKQMLMAMAQDEKGEMSFRQEAISAYLRAADAEETKNALLSFLAEDDRMDYMERLSIYEYARMVFEQADEQKRIAILNALYVAAAVPDLPPLEFRVCDEILVKLSPAYAQSNQRFELLKKYNSISYPENRKETKKILKERMDIMRKSKFFTNVSTNLVILKSRNFNLPQPDLSTNDKQAVANDATIDKSNTSGSTRRIIVMYTLSGLAALLLLGLGIWKFARK